MYLYIHPVFGILAAIYAALFAGAFLSGFVTEYENQWRKELRIGKCVKAGVQTGFLWPVWAVQFVVRNW